MLFHQILFYLLILLLPTQLGRHFWPSWSFIHGIRLDYLSPAIYLTDIIIGGILLSWLLPKLKIAKIHTYLTNDRRSVIQVFLVFFFLSINALLANNQIVAFVKLLKLTELFLLAVYVAKTRPNFRLFVICFLLSVFWSSLLAWLQFLKQSSLGGIFWLLGERTFTVITPGIATVILNGKMLLRPYATFPHPNVLAGYLTILLPFLLISSYQGTTLVKARQKAQLPEYNLGKFLLPFSLFTIFLTFSRSAWIVATIIILISLAACFLVRNHTAISPNELNKSFSKKPLSKKQRFKRSTYLNSYSILIMSIFFLLSPLLFSRLRSLTTTDKQTLLLRQELNQAAIEMIKDHPLTGVGLNNFLPQLPNYRPIKSFQDLQPTHNIYLLITAETGLMGLGIFLILIFKACRRLISNFKIQISNQFQISKSKFQNKKFYLAFGFSLSAILLLGLFDHYFYTLQQTQALFVIILGLVYVQTPQTLNLPRPRPCS